MKRLLICSFGLVLLVVALGGGSGNLASGTAAADSTSYYEPPINVIFTVHIEPFRQGIPLAQRQQEYEARRQDLEYPLKWIEDYGIKPTVLGGGEFVEFCLDSEECGEDPPSGLFVDLMARGIDMGTHWHWGYRQGLHDWPEVKNPDAETARRIVTDNREMVDRVVGRENNVAGNGLAHYPGMHPDQGFVMAPGLGEGGEAQFGHVVWNPWRPGEGPGFPEDLSAPYVAIPHLPQIGLTGGKPGSVHVSDLRLPYVKSQFLMIFLEWREHERQGDPDKVWVWGVAYQLNIRTDETHEQNPAFFEWLSENFIGKTTPRGTLIARYATVTDVYDEFRAWEEAHPGVSSFHWEPGDPYPYSMPAVVEKLKDAAYEEAITTWQAQGISVHRLSRGGAPLYVVYADAGERQIDFSSELSGRLQVTDGQGNTQTLEASSLTVTEAPLFVEPVQTVAQAQVPIAPRTPHTVERLDNGNTLITDGGISRRDPDRHGTDSRVIEVDPQGNVVWSYEEGLNWAHSAERLPNGNTLITDTGHDRVIEVDPEGNIVWNSDEISLSDGSHLDYPNDANRLENDRLLITDRDNHRVIEIDRDGNILWQFGVTGVPGDDEKHLKHPHNADRLDTGNTILADSENDRILEVSPDGAVVWEYKPAGTDALRWPRDADRLENGDTLITDSRNGRVLEVTPAGEVIWEYNSLNLPYEADRLPDGHTLIAGAASGGGVIEVDESGTVVWQYPVGAGSEASKTARYLLISYNANYLWGPPDRVRQANPEGFVRTLNRHLDLMERYGVKADYYFTGLAAEKLAEWSPETVERLLNPGHGINYHGANRPPYPQLVDLVGGENWGEDVATVRTYEAEGINPATGEHVGGIAAFRDAFGREPFATGRFFEASILYVDKRLGARMGVGLKGNTGGPREDAWFLGVLNRPEQAGLPASGLGRAAIRGEDEKYLAHARAILTSVDGPFPVVAFPIHDHDFYKYPPADQEKVWGLYEEALRLALELGFRPVTLREIYTLVQNGPAPTLGQDGLLRAAQGLIETMESTGYPPEYVTVGEMPYSLAEIFEALARALAAYQETSSLPEAIETHDLLGPTEAFTSSFLQTMISAEAVVDVAVTVPDALIDQIPSRVAVEGYIVNPAEFLYLMAQEYVAVSESEPASVSLWPISLLPLSVVQNEEADPLTKLQFWTYKPALFALNEEGAGR